jgi:membrane protein DedA with SNARE-associated domain
MAELWAEWGGLAYAIAALWAFFEGETFVLAAAAVGAAAGGIDPWILMFVVWGGSFAGDQTWFFIGRRFGPSALARFPRCQRNADRAMELLHLHGTLFVLSFRFLYGIRNVAAAACGLAGMPYRRFAVLNFIGAGVWASSFVAAGWFLGSWLGVERLFQLICGAVFVALAVLVGRGLLRRRAARRVLPA